MTVPEIGPEARPVLVAELAPGRDGLMAGETRPLCEDMRKALAEQAARPGLRRTPAQRSITGASASIGQSLRAAAINPSHCASVSSGASNSRSARYASCRRKAAAAPAPPPGTAPPAP